MTEGLLDEEEDSLGDSSGSSKASISSVIAGGRNGEACMHEANSALASSISQFVMESPKMDLNCSHVSSFLLFV